ncbi:HIT domain-containing protein [Nakamurella deserti]|uniref:HIT domain-containing protein n=1 Tax=Nakamurella deserti TaxID=2164074 RepID=UPI000DBE945E|nr:HIT domain-containing protein [Nakamurella deserti]
MPDCVFCAIASGAIPADLVAETDTTLAFRDLDPKADVHVLVIPRAHFDNLGAVAAADPATAAAMITTAAGVAAAEGVADSGYRLIANTGAGGGQTVFHAHLHLLAGSRLPGF